MSFQYLASVNIILGPAYLYQLEMLTGNMDALFLPLAKALDVTVEQIKVIYQALCQRYIAWNLFFEPQLLSCLLIAYPLGALFVQVPSSKPTLRHLFNIIMTIVFFFPIFRLYSAFFQCLASILFTYIVANYHKGKSMPWVVFVCVASFQYSGWRSFLKYNFQDRDGPSSSYFKVSSKASLK